MWLPNTKTALVNEIYYIWKWHYKRYEIERVYLQELYREHKRNKYYSKRAWIKRLQAFLIKSREDIRKFDGDLEKLEYNITIK